MNENYLLTSESVSEGHPDKICDQISDGILDAVLNQDPMGRVGCETAVTTGLVLVFGEITTNAKIDFKSVVKDTIKKIGYNNPSYGFDSDSCAILIAIDEQSTDIKEGVDNSLETRNNLDEKQIGAGDQGMMIGYACDETEELMPIPISLSHKLTQRISHLRKNGISRYLRPDAKSQVTVEYSSNNIPLRVDTIILAAQHDPEIDQEYIEKDLINNVINNVIPSNLIDKKTKIHINPSGRFVIGGPVGDAGLTGRKIIADTYGGSARHGGGAFSGKDPTKVDRSGAYAARWVAKNIVASGIAKQVEVQISYAIGVASPVSIMVETKGTGKFPDYKIEAMVKNIFDLRAGAIISDLNLRRPIYQQVSTYGHFGRNELNLPWENLDKVDDIKNYLN
ncbi:MAG: methionine adenosyltransferase [Chloroflexi bacterium]|nr:methionine adenosyltransferase [Chloroflexota bacterium]